MADDFRSWQDQETLQFLGKEAPRYTSYPSAHHFVGIVPDTYASWLRAIRTDQSIGLYLHVPFCEQMCHFCGCNTQITLRYDPIETYVACLREEIIRVRQALGFAAKVHSVHFGGGSPGILRNQDMHNLFSLLREAFDIGPEAEISIELDPRRLTPDKASTLAEVGVNRVSLGVQDTNEATQNAINRVQPLRVLQSAFDMLRTAGLSAVGLDLMYGLPHQSIVSLTRTLSDVATLNPDRISAFSYAHVPWMKKHQKFIDGNTLPDLRQKVDQFLCLDEGLQAMDYTAIGIDHFAKKNDGLALAKDAGSLRRNFMGYTDLPNEWLIGLGASSISQLDMGMAQNVSQATTYQSRLAEGGLATHRGWQYEGDDRVRAHIISQLMCNSTVDVGQVLRDHHYDETYLDEDMKRLDVFVDAGLVTVNGRQVVFDSPLRMIVRSVACVFDRYANAADADSRYSKIA